MSTTTAPPVWGPTNYKIQEQQDREHMHGKEIAQNQPNCLEKSTMKEMLKGINAFFIISLPSSLKKIV